MPAILSGHDPCYSYSEHVVGTVVCPGPEWGHEQRLNVSFIT